MSGKYTELKISRRLAVFSLRFVIKCSKMTDPLANRISYRFRQMTH